MAAWYVRCKVSPGIFDSEFYVVVSNSSAYVNRSNVRVQAMPREGTEVEGEVLAYLVEENPEEALIELPGEPVVGGLRTWIPKTELSNPVETHA